MSEAVKKSHIEVQIGNRKTKRFLVPKEKAVGLEKLLSEYEVSKDCTISADKVFQDLDKKYSKVGNVLAGLRLRDELTQSELAKKAGTSQPVIAAIETGKRKVGKNLAHKLAKIFKSDFRMFLG